MWTIIYLRESIEIWTAISRQCCNECACGGTHTHGCCRPSEIREIFQVRFPPASRLANCTLATYMSRQFHANCIYQILEMYKLLQHSYKFHVNSVFWIVMIIENYVKQIRRRRFFPVEKKKRFHIVYLFLILFMLSFLAMHL